MPLPSPLQFLGKFNICISYAYQHYTPLKFSFTRDLEDLETDYTMACGHVEMVSCRPNLALL